jgi:hypothetical protein
VTHPAKTPFQRLCSRLFFTSGSKNTGPIGREKGIFTLTVGSGEKRVLQLGEILRNMTWKND